MRVLIASDASRLFCIQNISSFSFSDFIWFTKYKFIPKFRQCLGAAYIQMRDNKGSLIYIKSILLLLLLLLKCSSNSCISSSIVNYYFIFNYF
jgi:hypothetical protein